MNFANIIDHLHKGIDLRYDDHIQGFPDNACASLKGVYSLIYPKAKEYSSDPRYKAGAVLSLIAVAGGLISVNKSSYTCNNGFIDSFGDPYPSDNPVLEVLRIHSEKYYYDSFFVDKAVFSLGTDLPQNRPDHSDHSATIRNNVQITTLRSFIELAQLCFDKTKNEDERCQIGILIRIAGLLAMSDIELKAPAASAPSWDHEKWLKEFLPIWNSRNRYFQHNFRAAYYETHVDIVEEGRYISQSGNLVEIPWDGVQMMNSSIMYSQEITDIAPPETEYDTSIEVWLMDCLDAAKKVQLENPGTTAVLNLANRQNPGGGVYSGSGAQEESCFLRSNYFTALYPFAHYAYYYDLPKSQLQYPMDRNFGGVWSKGITVFRGRELEGYPLLDQPWKTNFIAVAAINRPPVTVINGEERLTPEMEQATLNKIHTILNIAAVNKVDNLILGALGCGAFRNPPKHIAELFKQALNEDKYKHRFNKVVFAIIGEQLCSIFSDVFGCQLIR